MDVNEILETLEKSDENERLEVKRGSEIGKSVMETICSFSNGPDIRTGTLLLGVEENKDRSSSRRYKVSGVTDPDKLQKDLASKCAAVFNIPINPKISVESINGRTVLIVTVEELESSQKPLFFKAVGLPKGAFCRVGSADRRCTLEELQYLCSRQEEYENRIMSDTSLSDVSEEALREYRRLRKAVNEHAEEIFYTDEELLQSLKCIKKDKGGVWRLTISGLIVFGSKEALRRELPAIRLDYTRVSGTKWSDNPDTRFERVVELRSPAILLVSGIINAIMEDMPHSFRLRNNSLQAETPPILPMRVLREGIVNAIIHRQYSVSSPIHIVRYGNCLEIRNPGYSLKPIEVLDSPDSYMRNPNIASIFHETNLAETKGSGFRTMRKLMESAHLLPPTCESDREANRFVLHLYLFNLLDSEDLEWLRKFEGLHLSDHQKLALSYLRESNSTINRGEYCQISGLGEREASKELKQLVDLGLLRKDGKKRGTTYGLIVDRGSLADIHAAYQPLFPHVSSLLSPTVTANSDDSTVNSGDSTVNSGDSTVNSGDSTVNSGDSTVNSGDITVNSGDSTVNSGDITVNSGENITGEMPEILSEELMALVREIKKRADPKKMRHVLLRLCLHHSLSVTQLSTIIGRGDKYLRNRYLNPMMKKEWIGYTIPNNPRHPAQAYRTTEKGKKIIEEYDL